MVILIRFKKKMIFFIVVIFLIVSALTVYLWNLSSGTSAKFIDEEIKEKLTIEVQHLLNTRNLSLLEEDKAMLAQLYDLEIQQAQWAFEYELKKMKHLHQWSSKQGINFKEIDSHVVVRKVQEKDKGFDLNLLVSTEYKYVYNNIPEVYNTFRLGTYHSLKLMPHEKGWVITREWYGDPFMDSLQLDALKKEELQRLILSSEAQELSALDESRMNVVAYADQYCGAASLPEYGFQYNPNYRDYNNAGGNCANFISQALYEGGNFKKNRTWNYERGAGSREWINAGYFHHYMLYSGRASKIAYGTYEEVLENSFKLLPGDYIAYEKKGDITHVSLVTGIDSKGYILVNSHNADRYRVPWDLGWSNNGINFYLVRVNY